MKKRMIRLLSLALCLLSLVSLLPVTALAASTLGKPTELEWNTSRCILGGELYTDTVYGVISFKAAEPYRDGMNYFFIKVYKDNKVVYNDYLYYDSRMIEEEQGYLNADLSSVFENGSGTYRFTIAAVDRDSGESGKTATSKDYKFTKPTARVDKPTNVRLEWPYAKWEGDGNYDTRYECRVYFSSTKSGTEKQIFTFMGYGIDVYKINGYYGTGYYTIWVRTHSNNIAVKNHSSWVKVEDVYVKFDGPEVEITNVSSSGKPKLTWSYTDQHTKNSVVEHAIYRSTSKDGTYSKIGTTSKGSYTDSSATAGKKYYYKVKGLTYYGATTYSNIVNTYCDLARPTAKVSLTSKGNIKVTWDKVSGASKYAVYRAESEDGEYKLMKTTTGTSYTNTSADIGKTYYYKVQALHEKESANSAMSTVVSGTRKLIAPTIAIENVSSTGKIKVSWDAVDDAATYKVFRATSSGGTYTELAEVSDTSYTDTSAVAGKTYYYKVQAVAADPSFVSSKSGYKYRTCDLARPNVTITLKSNGDPRLTWDAIEGAEKYEIYRATSKSGTYEKIKTVTGTSFTNTAAKAGKTYYYKVKAIHSNSAANSAYSSVDKVSIPK